MRWTIVGLLIVGLIAADAAAVLIMTLKASGRGDRSQEERNNEIIRVLVAARDLPARTIVEAGAVATDEIRRGDAPANFLSDSVQAVGQMLVQPVKSGEPFTRQSFATAENPIQLSKGLDPGHRIVSLMLSDDTGIDQLLYPGCLVDILGSFSVPSTLTDDEERGEKLSVTLLQGIPVLAVGPKTIVSTPEGASPTAGPGDSAGRRARIVAFDVTVKQAEMLQLASKYGSVSVSLRSPLDTALAETSGTLMGEFFKNLEEIGQLSTPGETFAPATLPDIKSVVANAGNNNGASGGTTTTPAPIKRPTQYHTTTVLRGKDVEQMKFPIGPPGENQE